MCSDHEYWRCSRCLAPRSLDGTPLRESWFLVPSGYVLAPEEPTPAMVDAALRSGDAIDPRAIVIEDYRAMIAARPLPGAPAK